MFTVFTWPMAIVIWLGLYIVLEWQRSKIVKWYSYDRWLILAFTGFICTLGFVCFQNFFLESQQITRLASLFVEIPFSICVGIALFLPWLLIRKKRVESVKFL
jgi:hypothetical protein